MNRRSFVSFLAALPFVRFFNSGKKPEVASPGVFHKGVYCSVCSGMSDLGRTSPLGRVRNNIANAIVEAKQPREEIRAVAAHLRDFLRNPETAQLLAAQGLKIDYEQLVSQMAERELSDFYQRNKIV
jgi:hypothetical protein